MESNNPYENAWKSYDLGSHAIGAYAGFQNRGLYALRNLRGFLTRHTKPDPGPKTREHIRNLIFKGAAKVKVRGQLNEFQVLVAYALSDGSYELQIVNERGLQGIKWNDDRGPYLFGTGGVNPEPFDRELQVLSSKMRYEFAGHQANMLHRDAHALAATFLNAYIKQPSDRHTGGGLLIMTLSAGRGVQYFSLSEFEGDVDDESTYQWHHHTPEYLTAQAFYKPNQRSLGILLERGDIAGLLTDQKDVLTVLSHAKPTLVELTTRRAH